MSADYLRMERLTSYALDYAAKHFTEITQKMTNAVDSNGISDCIYSSLSAKLTDMQIERVDDKKNYRFKSKLFMQKLEQFFADDANKLNICQYCTKLFSWKHIDYLKCNKARIFIDYHGIAISKHMEGKALDTAEFVNFIHYKCKLSWRIIYWKLWAYTIMLYCQRCDKYFRGTEVKQCLYHSEKPIYKSGNDTRRYPCCNTIEKLFHTGIYEETGCKGKMHEPRINNENDKKVPISSELGKAANYDRRNS